jgi:uncharacterized membrane protein
MSAYTSFHNKLGRSKEDIAAAKTQLRLDAKHGSFKGRLLQGQETTRSTRDSVQVLFSKGPEQRKKWVLDQLCKEIKKLLGDKKDILGRLETILLSDPLAAVTRRNRKTLLMASLITLFFGYARLVPRELKAFGLSFKDIDPKALLIIGAVVVFYFLVTFLLYGLSDWLLRQSKVREPSAASLLESVQSKATKLSNLQQVEVDSKEVETILNNQTLRNVTTSRRLAYRARWFLDLAAPVLVGIIAIVILVTAEVPGANVLEDSSCMVQESKPDVQAVSR